MWRQIAQKIYPLIVFDYCYQGVCKKFMWVEIQMFDGLIIP